MLINARSRPHANVTARPFAVRTHRVLLQCERGAVVEQRCPA